MEQFLGENLIDGVIRHESLYYNVATFSTKNRMIKFKLFFEDLGIPYPAEIDAWETPGVDKSDNAIEMN